MNNDDTPVIVVTLGRHPVVPLPEAKIKRGRGKKDPNNIIHPIFKEAAAYSEDDPFWEEILNRISYGSFSKGFGIDEKGCYFYKKTKTKNVTLEVSSNPEDVCRAVISFMRTNGSIYSTRDAILEKTKTEEGDSEPRDYPKAWTSITPRSNQPMYLSRYFLSLRDNYNLNEAEFSQLENIVNSWLNSSTFNPKSIILEEGHIKDIKPLIFSRDLRRFTIDKSEPAPKPAKVSKSTKVEKKNSKTTSGKWEKTANTMMEKMQISGEQ